MLHKTGITVSKDMELTLYKACLICSVKLKYFSAMCRWVLFSKESKYNIDVNINYSIQKEQKVTKVAFH